MQLIWDKTNPAYILLSSLGKYNAQPTCVFFAIFNTHAILCIYHIYYDLYSVECCRHPTSKLLHRLIVKQRQHLHRSLKLVVRVII